MSLRSITSSWLLRRNNFGGVFSRSRPNGCCRRNFSSELTEVPTPTTLTSPSPPPSLGEFIRHGKGDGVIILDVGGTKFKTLRSTVATNTVLARHVARAEANGELTEKGSAVFIDRDPKYFGLILQHLRNRVDGLTVKSSFGKSDSYVQLPKDRESLRDIYVEAAHYQLKSLQNDTCGTSVTTSITKVLGGGKNNPFDMASMFITQFRRLAVAVTGFLTATFGMGGTPVKLSALPAAIKQNVLGTDQKDDVKKKKN